MKKLIKIGLLSTAFLVTLIANASEKLNIKVAANASKMMSISLTKVVFGETISIKDSQGNVLFSERLSKVNSYDKVFSLSALPSGLYFIEANENEKIQVTPIIVNENNVQLLTESVKTFKAPQITFSEDVIRVLVDNENKEKVSINIYNEFGILLSSTDNNSNALIFGSYDISNLVTDNVVISITEGDYNFVKEIKL